MSWYVSPWVYPVWDSLCLLDLIDYVLFHVGESFNYNLFKKFPHTLSFSLLLLDSYHPNVGVFDMASEVSETVLSSFHSFYFILLFRIISTILSSSSLIHSSVSNTLLIDSFWSILGSKITADGDCSHEIKRRLLIGRKVMTNLDSIFKSRDITWPTKVGLVKAMVFPVVMYGCESWTVKKAEC